MDLTEIRSEDVEWFHMDQNRDQLWDLLNTEMNFRVP
jgi:hypothetical protein